MLKPHLLFYSLLITILFAHLLVYGQQDDKNLLPDIDPQDIEIKGNYRPQFPGLRRQPILGFNPKPRVFQVDPFRMPFLETPEQVAAEIPVSYLERPSQPPVQFLEPPTQRTGYIQGGFGMFYTPNATFDLERLSTNRGSWRLSGNFLSSSGHTPEISDLGYSRNTQFRDGEINFSHRKILERGTHRDIRLSFDNDLTYLYRVNAINVQPGVSLGRQASLDNFKRHANTGGIQVLWRRHKSAWSERTFTIGTYGTVNEQQTATGNRVQTELIGELRYSSSWESEKPERVWSFELNTKNSFFESSQQSQFRNRSLIQFGRKNTNTTKWHLNLGVSGLVLSDGDFTPYVFPEISLKSSRMADLQMDIWIIGDAILPDLRSLFGNQYVDIGIASRELDQWRREVFYEGGTKAVLKPSKRLHFTGMVTARNYQRFRYLSNQRGAGLFNYAFESNVTQIRPSLEVLINLTENGSLYVQNEIYLQQFVSEDFTVPYAEAFGLVSSLRWDRNDRWFGFVSLRYVGSRETESGSSPDAAVLLESKIEYFITKSFGLHLTGMNLLNEKYYWVSNYQERPIEVLGGLSISW